MTNAPTDFINTAIHVIVAELRENLSRADLQSLYSSAYALKQAPAVHNVSLGVSDTHLIISVELVLSDSLEEFSDSSGHMEFVVHSLGKYITGMWSVDFQCNEEFPTNNTFFSHAKSITALAVKGDARVFEWQITKWFQDLHSAMPDAIIASGHTIEERDRHRACALILLPKEIAESSQALFEIVGTLGIATESLEIAAASLSQPES